MSSPQDGMQFFESNYYDEYEYYNFDTDKIVASGQGSGKGRTKREQELHSTRFDPCGNVRITVTKFQNTERKRKNSNDRS
uniref:p8 protein n=1 Tax=Branchiostoma belcheri tsingtauense TaxID=155462 RepID=Q6WLC3_BRABE|nr:p8 protein [Branchiostoma belcheri tsingtauense]